MAELGATNSQPVSPGGPDEDNIHIRCSGLYVGNGGDLTVQLVGDEGPVLFEQVQNGSFVPVQAIRVLANGTTATKIVALGRR